jgi:flagellar motility protein MotE (MotC chaperone)
MRTVWTIISWLAVVHLLALAGFAGWLAVDGRLSGERMERIREMLGERVVDEQARLEAEAAEGTLADAVAAEEAKSTGMPIPASARIAEGRVATELASQVALRQTREIEDLRESLAREREDLDKEWALLNTTKAEFQAYLEGLAETTGTQQFKKAIQTLEGQKPKDAAAMLESLLGRGKEDEVVSYLNAMEERARNKVFAALPDPSLAADLLERLRTRGIETPESPEDGT